MACRLDLGWLRHSWLYSQSLQRDQVLEGVPLDRVDLVVRQLAVGELRDWDLVSLTRGGVLGSTYSIRSLVSRWKSVS